MSRNPLESVVLERCLSIVNRSEMQPIVESFVKGEKDDSKQTRMLCGRISAELFDKVEQTASLLRIGKRQFIELAVSTAVARAEEIIEQEGVYEVFELADGAGEKPSAGREAA